MKVFNLFTTKDINTTAKFFKVRSQELENDIREIELDHIKELKKDLMIENIVKLLSELILSKRAEDLKKARQTRWKSDKDTELKKHFSKVYMYSKRLLRIIELANNGNRKLLKKLKDLRRKLELYKEGKGKLPKGTENILQITINQISWREQIIKFFDDMIAHINKLVEVSGEDVSDEQNIKKYEKLKKLQIELYEIVKNEIKLSAAEQTTELLEENEDSMMEKIEEYYFKSQKATIDTGLNTRRKLIKSHKDRLLATLQSVNLIMVPVGFFPLKYTRYLSMGACQNTKKDVVKLREKHKELIKESKVTIPTRKNYTIAGTYFEKTGSDKVIVILHEHVHGRFHQLIDALEYKGSFNVLIYDNTGHFGSGGHCGMGLEEADDFVDVLNWLIDKKKNTGIGIYGISLGGATAIGGIERFPRQEYVKAAVFQAAFSDRDEIIDEYSKKFLKFPNCKLRRIMRTLIDRKYKGKTKYTPKELIRKIKCPIFLIHDIEDPWMDFRNSEELAKNVRSPLKTLFRHGYEHYETGNTVKRHLVLQFLKKYL